MVKIQNENGGGKINPRQFPNPSRAIANKDHFRGPCQAASHSFGPDAGAKIGCAFKTADIGGGGMIAHRQAFLVGFGLGEDGPQFGFPRLGRCILRLAGPARQFFIHHRHARAIDFGIEDGNEFGLLAGALLQLGGQGGSAEVDQALDLASLQAHAGLGQQILAGRLVAFFGRRPRRQANQGRGKAVDQPKAWSSGKRPVWVSGR